MSEEKTIAKKLNLFETESLNVLAQDIFTLDNQYQMFMKRAEESIHSAFKTRWLYGKKISENYDTIIKECGTQKEFAKRIKKSEAVVSNNKRAYENLLEFGCETFEDVVEVLEKREIRPTVTNFEKIGTLLNEPEKDTEQKEQVPKDRKRLEQIMAELNDIVKRNEPGSFPDIREDAEELIEDTEQIIEYIENFRPKTTKFSSEKYLEFVRSFGYDTITLEPCERCHPHHADPDGGTGGTGDKLPDYYAIPVSESVHKMIHLGILEPTAEEILRAQFWVMSAFIKMVMSK